MRNEKKRFKAKKASKKAIFAMWSDSDSRKSESDEAKMAGFFHLAKGNLEIEEDEDSKKVKLEYLFTFMKEYLAQELLKCVRYKQEYLSEIKALKKENKILKKRKKKKNYEVFVNVCT